MYAFKIRQSFICLCYTQGMVNDKIKKTWFTGFHIRFRVLTVMEKYGENFVMENRQQNNVLEIESILKKS